MPTPPPKPISLAKPTIDTLFYVDYDWWTQNPHEDLRAYRLSQLPPEVRLRLGTSHENRVVDFIDPETGEVSHEDELGLALRSASKSPDFLANTSIVDGVFRVFIRNNNTPTRVGDIAKQIDADAKVVLDLIRKKIYKGIKPYEGHS